ncbi:sialophorin like 2 precursor [Rattus norvegicus]|uniref:Sialophorin like 2 n=2 Tax=Rattus norvegicus TaxID=10116 RepID=Q4KM82_RAT|nr:sialophorin like 2 precursor [Rattus norvegicus]AAH98706.1 Similar to Leukosialin precursor (Leucocyte sialoglycoprotein) (Sialophorin) (CD43) (W3/13 antigen) [Rattus norvegicus]|eukprot:NP_001020930.1 uncharacterized protein LOC498157 precursor [Rattus norvegicus]
MEMALLLLLFGGFWAQVVSQENLQNMSMLPFSLHSTSPIAMLPGTVDPKESISPWRQTPVPASLTPLGTPELFSFETPADTSRSTPVTEPTTSQDISNTELSILAQKLSDVLSDPPVTITNPVTIRTSLETFTGSSAPPVTVTTSSTTASGQSVAITVSSESSGPPVTMTIGGTPGSGTKISRSTPNATTTMSPRQGFSAMGLLPLLIALVVVLALIIVLRLWHQRQKGRNLSRGGILNRLMDAWAGSARVPDEENTTGTARGSNKCSGAPETDSCGRRPNVCTFFSRWKSSQCSLEELKPGKDPNLKGEKEPLVGSEAKAVETPTSDKPQVKDGAAPQSQ